MMIFIYNKMIIRRNLPLSNQPNNPNNNDLFGLSQKRFIFEEQTPNVHFPSLTLNPEHPINSVLVSNTQKQGLVAVNKQDSEFSFKQRGFLSEEDPQQLDLPSNDYQQNSKISTKKLEQPLQSEEKALVNHRKPLRAKKCIGMITNHNQLLAHSRANPSETSQKCVRKPQGNSLGSSRLQSVLSKIKSLRIDAGNHPQSLQSHRYSTVRQEDQKVSSTDASGQETSPIRRQVISNIRKQIQRMNMSLIRDHRIRQEDTDSDEHSLLFKIQEKSQRNVDEDILQSKNKSFLVRSTNKKVIKVAEIVQISYKTTLLQLKQLCVRYDQTVKVKFTVPSILAKPIFNANDEEQTIFQKAVQALQQLSVASLQPLTIRRYSNCVIVLNDNLALISHFTARNYFGGWKNGSKHGLGLQLVPQKWVYYGEYRKNRREGYGVMKQWSGGVLAGQWRASRDLGSKIF